MKPRKITVGKPRDIVVGPFADSTHVFAAAMRGPHHCFSRSGIDPLWTVDADGLELSIAVEDNVIAVAGRGVWGARDVNDGGLLWTTPGGKGMRIWNRQFAVFRDAEVEFFQPRDGASLTAWPVPNGILSPGHICGDVCILENGSVATMGQDPKMHEALGADGASLWRRSLVDQFAAYVQGYPHSQAVGVAGVDGSDVFIAAHKDSTFGCSLRDGSFLWHQPVAVEYFWPDVVGGRVYVLTEDRFVALDALSGRVVFDRSYPALTPGLRPRPGVFFRGRAAFPSLSGRLVVLDLDDGSLVSLVEAKVPLWHAVEADGQLVVGTGAGTLLVFDESIWGPA